MSISMKDYSTFDKYMGDVGLRYGWCRDDACQFTVPVRSNFNKSAAGPSLWEEANDVNCV